MPDANENVPDLGLVVTTRTGRIRVEEHGDRFVVTAGGHVGPLLVREDLRRAEDFGRRRTAGWWYVVDTTDVVLPNPLNVRYLRRIRALPGLAGYVVIAPNPALRMVARLLEPISRPDAIVASRREADAFIDAVQAGRRPMFVFDGDCGFCTRWARWLGERTGPGIDFVSLRDSDDRRTGLTTQDIKSASVLIDEAGRHHWGSDGFAQAFRRSPGPWAALGTLGLLPGPRALAQMLYRLVARNRHRLPGPPDA